MIDLRSDTITQPTEEMRLAMARAEVGDDVLGDDPTIKALEQRTAEVLGKAAAVYMPSGTMTNQAAVRTHTQPGDEILIEASGHIYLYEAGGPAALSGVMVRLIEGRRGIFSGDDLEAALRPPDLHFARQKLVCVENTSNRGGGSVWTVSQLLSVAQCTRDHGLKLHLDGARLWNAAVASGISEAELAAPFDSVSVCFSKGLGAPVGSALAGSTEFITEARRFRKQFGGAMRQVGIIAAGALHALEHHRTRLHIDHQNAKKLAEGLSGLPGIELNPEDVETNIVIFRTTSLSASELQQRLEAQGVRMLAIGPDSIRAVTNLMVEPDQIDDALRIFSEELR